MRNVGYVVLFFVITNFYSVANAQVISIWSDDFETDKGWVYSGEFERGMPNGGEVTHGNSNPTVAFSGSNAIGTDLDGDYPNYLSDREYVAESPSIDCSGKENVTLSFYRWLNIEPNYYDHAYIDISIDGGSTWNNIWQNGTDAITEFQWSLQSIDISGYADNSSNVRIRFALGTTDNVWKFSGWNIDDVNITGTLANPIGFTAVANGDNTSSDINIEWTLNMASDTVIIVGTSSDVLADVSPSEGAIYAEDDEMVEDVIVIYKGKAEGYTDSPLKYGTTYYYKAWSTQNGVYSNGVTANATTNSKIDTKIALIETWGDTGDGDDITWNTSYSLGLSSDTDIDNWMVGSDQSSNNSGHSAYISYGTNNGAVFNVDYNKNFNVHDYVDGKGGGLWVTYYCSINLEGYSINEPCNLIFDWLCNGRSVYGDGDNDAYGRVFVQLGDDSSTRTYFGGDENAENRYFDAIEWTSETFDMSKASYAVVGQSNVTLGFEWHNSAQGASVLVGETPSFCIDNIIIANASSIVTIDKLNDDVGVNSEHTHSTDADEVVNISFTDKNKSNTSANKATVINKFELTQGVENSADLSNWKDFIAGANLYYNGSVIGEGQVYRNKIAFTFDNALTLENETRNYQLYIWLKTDLSDNYNKGDSKFDFTIDIENIYMAYNSDEFIGQPVSSGGIPIIKEGLWRGGTADWSIGSNWWTGNVPEENDNIYIPKSPKGGNFPIISSNINLNNLEIEKGATVIVDEGASVSINGDLVTNDNFTIKTSVTSPVSVIAYGNVVGETNYEWTGLTNMYWWHIGLPVLNVANSEFDASYLSGTDYALNRYTTSGWERIAGISEVDADYDFNANLLEGYSLLPRFDYDLKYSGLLNNGSYSHLYNKAGWYLVANPYPSYINVRDEDFDIGNFMKTVFIESYDNIVSNYNILTNVGINEGTRYVAPGQAMWLRTYEASDAISIANTTRVHSTGSLKATTVDDDNIFRFTLEGSNNTDESVVLISNEFGSEFVSRFDSEKMMNGGNMVNIYSLKESKDISINALPEITTEQIVPLGYEVSEAGIGDFTFKASNINGFMQDVNVYLVDKVEEVTVNLRETPSYTFTASSTESKDRFELIFEASVTTGIDEDTKVVSDKNVMIYAVKQEATVKVTEQVLQFNDRIIEVYDVSGQLVKQVDLNDVETIFTLPQANMMYIINVKVDGNSYKEKVITQN